MRKTTILITLFFVLLAVSVAADSFVVGTIYLDERISGNEVGGANINVTCNGYTEETTSSDEEGVVGDYAVAFADGQCSDGSDVQVEASYEDMSGSASGKMSGLLTGLDIAIINVTIPEFGAITAGIALLGSICGVFLIRKRR